MNNAINSPVIVALDNMTKDASLALADQLDPALCRLKVGKELYTRCGPEIVRALHQRQFEVFLDLKFHDIPNTTTMASLFAARQNVKMFNVHASGGKKMMERVAKEVKALNPNTLTIAVTVLTSFSEEEIKELFKSEMAIKEMAMHWAKLTKESGMNGVVCSPWEAKAIKEVCGNDFVTVTPGIRPAWSAANDQTRIMTPAEALQNGCDYLVIGRPITGAENPKEAAERVLAEMETVLKA